MAIVASDLLIPNGPVTQKLFPGMSKVALATQLAGYITRAYADSRVTNEPDATKKDPIAKAMALHFAFTDVHVRMTAEPLTVNIAEKGSHGYSTEQIRNMRAMADQYLDEAQALMTVTATTTPGSVNMHVQTKFTW